MSAQEPNYQSAMEMASEQAAQLAKFLADSPLDYGAFFLEVAANLEKQVAPDSSSATTHPHAQEIQALARSLRQTFSG